MKALTTTLSALGALALLTASLVVEPLHPAWRETPLRSLAALLAGIALAVFALRRGLHKTWVASLDRTSDRAFLWSVFAAGAAAAGTVALVLFQGVSHLDDGVAAVFQARIFAAGHVTLPLPPLPEFFEVFGVLGRRVGHWCGMYPPGWPALLVPGVWLGATWIINPLLFGGICVFTTLFGTELYGRLTGRLAGLLALTSPLLLVLGGEQLSSTPTAFFLLVCGWSMLRLLRTGRAWFGLTAGAAWGMAFLCRPLSALLVGAVFALCALARPRALLPAWRGLALALLCAAGAAGLLAAFQHATTGNAATPGHAIGLGPRGRMGFGRLDAARTHTVALAAEYSLRRLRNLNHHLQAWPIPILLVALAPFLAGHGRAREWWLLLPLLALLLAFAAYWYYDMYYPSQYLTEGLPMLLLLAAAALCGTTGTAPGAAPRRVVWALPALCVCAAFALGAGAPSYLRWFHPNYGDVESLLPRVVQRHGITNAVVFMDQFGEGTDQHDPRNKSYATGFMRNDLALQGDVIYAWNLRLRNVELMRAYPGRAYYLYRFNRTTSRSRLYEMRPRDDGFDLIAVRPLDPALLEHAPVEPVSPSAALPPS